MEDKTFKVFMPLAAILITGDAVLRLTAVIYHYVHGMTVLTDDRAFSIFIAVVFLFIAARLVIDIIATFRKG